MTDHDHNHGLNMIDHDLNITGHEDIQALQADFRAAVVKAITGAGDDPEHPETRPQIEILEQKYANHLEQTGIYISGKNDIPGFRRAVFLSSEFTNRSFPGQTGVIAVTLDGRLVTGLVRNKNPDDRKPVTTAQAIKALGPHQSEQEFFHKHFWFYFDEKEDILDRVHKKSIFHDINSCISFFAFERDTETEIMDFLFQQIHDRLALVRCAILNALDGNVLRDIQKNNLMKVEHGCWLTGGDGAAEDVITARQQAVRAYPLMSAIFCENSRFHDIISMKISLSKAIAHYFNIEEYRVKRISGLTWEEIGSVPNPSIITEHIISEFLHLPDKYFPKNIKQFQSLDIMREFSQDVYGEDLVDFTGLLSKNSDPWQLATRMEQTSGSNVLDAMNFLVRKLLVPAMIARGKYPKGDHAYNRNEKREKAGLAAILKHFSVRELLDWSDRYHRNIARYEDCLDIISVNRDWPGILGTIDLGNGCRARELTSSVALKTQGRAENHCIGGYVSQILNKKEHSRDQAVMIFSIEQDDQILGTVKIDCSMQYSSESCLESRKPDDLEQGKKYLRAQVRQNYAYDNADPSIKSRNLAEQVAIRLQQAGPKVFRTYLDKLHDVYMQQDRISGLEFHIANCGFDPHNRVHLEKVWDELASALPQWFRRNGLDALIRHGLSRECPKKRSPRTKSSHQDRIIHAEGQQDELDSALLQRFRRNDLDILIKHGISGENPEKLPPGMKSSHWDRVFNIEGQPGIQEDMQWDIHSERRPEQDVQSERSLEHDDGP